MRDAANIKPSYAAPSIFEGMLKILPSGAADILEAVVSEAVVFGLVSEHRYEFKLVALGVKGQAECVASETPARTRTSFVGVEGPDVSLPLLEMHLVVLDVAELECADDVVLDTSALERWSVNMSGLSVRCADLEETALKRVVDLSGSVVTWIEAVVTRGELVCGLLKLRPRVLV